MDRQNLERLRDEFAIAAIAAILQDTLTRDEEENDGDASLIAAATACYRFADAMLLARALEGNGTAD